MSGEVITRKNLRRTTRSRIIFYEGIVSVLYIGSLTTRRCLITVHRRCASLTLLSTPSTLSSIPFCHRPIFFSHSISLVTSNLVAFIGDFLPFLSSKLLFFSPPHMFHCLCLVSSSRSRFQVPRSCIPLVP